MFFFYKQKTAYEMRISDWSSDVCSSDLVDLHAQAVAAREGVVWRDEVHRRGAGADRNGNGLTVAQRHDERSISDRGVDRGGVNDSEIGRASCRERVCQYV